MLGKSVWWNWEKGNYKALQFPFLHLPNLLTINQKKGREVGRLGGREGGREGWMDEWMDGWMDRWMDGWIKQKWCAQTKYTKLCWLSRLKVNKTRVFSQATSRSPVTGQHATATGRSDNGISIISIWATDRWDAPRSRCPSMRTPTRDFSSAWTGERAEERLAATLIWLIVWEGVFVITW